MTDNHQVLMDSAYAKWGDLHKDEWLKLLTPAEQFAVHTGNLNYQVGNGGLLQWSKWGNNYETDAIQYLRYTLPGVGPASREILGVINEYLKIRDRYNDAWNDDMQDDDWEAFHSDTDGLTSKFYEHSTDFLVECEAYINEHFKLPTSVDV